MLRAEADRLAATQTFASAMVDDLSLPWATWYSADGTEVGGQGYEPSDALRAPRPGEDQPMADRRVVAELGDHQVWVRHMATLPYLCWAAMTQLPTTETAPGRIPLTAYTASASVQPYVIDDGYTETEARTVWDLADDADDIPALIAALRASAA